MQLKNFYVILCLLAIVNCTQAQFNEKVFDHLSAAREGNRQLYGYNRFINKFPFAVKDSVVIFFLRDKSGARQVSLCGSFSNWSELKMTKTDSGWIAFTKLPAGKHLYKFIIDGEWKIDDDNLSTENDDQGNTNSIYYKPNIAFSLQGFTTSKKIWLCASFNNWKTDELPLVKTISGWQIPLFLSDGVYKYKFIIDNQWYHDPKNYQRINDKAGSLVSMIKIGNPDSIKDLAYYLNELALSEETGDELRSANAFTNIGSAYARMNNHPLAIQNFQKAKVLYEKLKDNSAVADMLLNIAQSHRDLSDFPRMLEYLQKATKEYEKNGSKIGLAKTYRLMGYYYLNLPYFPAAITFFKQSLNIYQQLKEQKEIANLFIDLGHSYLLTQDTAKILPHLQQALHVNQAIGNKLGIARALGIIGDYYFKFVSDIPKALDHLHRSMVLFEEAGSKVGVAQVLANIATIYLSSADSVLMQVGIPPSEKYTRALAYQKTAQHIFKELLPESEQLFTLYRISETFEKMGSADSAYHYYKQYVGLREKVLSTEKQKDIVRLETKYEYERKEDSLKLQQFLSDEKLQKQLSLFQQQQQQLVLNRSLLALSNKEKDIQHLAYLKTQADLQNEQLIKEQKVKENQLQSTQLTTLKQEKAINSLNQQKQWTYIIAGFVLLALSFFYFFNRSRLQSVRLETQLVKEKAEQERKDTEFQRKLSDVSMSALRSQMNPHFIFNCLNSIKLYTTQNDIAAASEYLTKFSKLIRLVLENSRNEHITLSSELAALQLYIQMEAMRFKEKLSYDLVVENNVEATYIEIPPLLLQPYVENAIWHGLMPKDDGGHIKIRVGMQRDEILEINITDNGIGRAAAALNNTKVGKHRSYGMKATTERISLINHVYKTGASVFVQDLVDDEGRPTGTQVTLQIPV
jgi:tetratricopeptide (TPR) repeat protein